MKAKVVRKGGGGVKGVTTPALRKILNHPYHESLRDTPVYSQGGYGIFMGREYFLLEIL